ncbi:ATP-binding protein [Mycolicibacterium sp. J2]|uniref:ATP-binding protein n=1 Tax=Mycolicibacterium sp. J2 TaxID=2993511 RepID=UPI00224B7CD6|nr:ATP-binding protein [Mycolicibacterium sp. J2]MCX2710922.1 ATP-binding protein [Mycolicibacterium sp. J2]
MVDATQSGTRFTRIGVTAAPERAAVLRHEFSEWLRGNFTLDPTKASDIVLAVNEALANAAEFAYVNVDQPGQMHLTADHDRQLGILTVTVSDEGSWRTKDPTVTDPARGRGIPLMHALSDRATIDTTPTGTQVCMQWDGIGVVPGGPSEVQNCGSRTT